MSLSPASAEIESDEPIDPELLARLEAALLTLPRFTREVFLAHRLDDLDYSEIARITGVGVHRVEREVARALVGISRAMEGRPRRFAWWERWR